MAFLPDSFLYTLYTKYSREEKVSLVETQMQGEVALLKLNNPASLNAMSIDMGKELKKALEECEKTARAIVLTGEGRAFCSGAALTGGGTIGPNPTSEFDAALRSKPTTTRS